MCVTYALWEEYTQSGKADSGAATTGQVKQVLDCVKVCLLFVDVLYCAIFFKAGN